MVDLMALATAMFTAEVIAVWMFVVTLAVVMLGYPVAFSLAGCAAIFAGIGYLMGVFDFGLFSGLASRYFGLMTNEILVAVPMFIFMGVMLERSGLAEELLTTMGQLFGSVRAGLGLSVIVVGGLLAASTGIVGATVVTMGLLSLPAMSRAGYDPKLASGIICSSGTLGQIIPPSAVLIFLGELLQSANLEAQSDLGNLAPQPLSVGQLFAGALLPGLMLIGLYMAWVIFKSVSDPRSCPALVMTAEEKEGLSKRVMFALLPPLLLVVAVLGSILFGIATVTESASMGAVGSLLLAAVNRRLDLQVLRKVMHSTLLITAMVFVILLGASVFSLVFRGLNGDLMVEQILHAIPGDGLGALIAVMAVMFVLGFFLDTFEIIFIMVPIAAPVLIKLGVDPIWLGVAIGINLQTSFVTPPFGFSLFYLRGVAGKFVSTLDIYRGIVPFVGLQLLAIAILWIHPPIATWLPKVLFSDGRGEQTFEQPVETGHFHRSPSTGELGEENFDDLFAPVPPSPSDTTGGDATGGADEDFGDLFAPRTFAPRP